LPRVGAPPVPLLGGKRSGVGRGGLLMPPARFAATAFRAENRLLSVIAFALRRVAPPVIIHSQRDFRLLNHYAQREVCHDLFAKGPRTRHRYCSRSFPGGAKRKRTKRTAEHHYHCTHSKSYFVFFGGWRRHRVYRVAGKRSHISNGRPAFCGISRSRPSFSPQYPRKLCRMGWLGIDGGSRNYTGVQRNYRNSHRVH